MVSNRLRNSRELKQNFLDECYDSISCNVCHISTIKFSKRHRLCKHSVLRPRTLCLHTLATLYKCLKLGLKSTWIIISKFTCCIVVTVGSYPYRSKQFFILGYNKHALV